MDIESLGKIVEFLGKEFENQEFNVEIPLGKEAHNNLQEKLWELDRNSKFAREDIFTIKIGKITFILKLIE
tara:strand:- start:399 stop:611 length:213 start_codon:yes stop_codon:yes gene_type:complete